MVDALDGIKIIETASAMAGPMAGRLLADWGADVIHVEPITGDIVRSTASTGGAKSSRGRIIESDIDYRFENHNCSKKGMTLDLSQKLGEEVMYKLLERADVFISNFRPRELKKFNLQYETLSQINPRLIFANITGYGRKGPDQDLPAYDFSAFWARSGALHVLQTPSSAPPATPNANGDRVASMSLACGIAIALFVRERTGVGQEVDVSLFNAGVYFNTADVAGSLVTGQDRQNVERDDIPNALTNAYKTKDGRWLRLAIAQPDRYWSRFCRAIERLELEQDPRFASFGPRIENHRALFYILEETFLRRPLTEWKTCLSEADLPWAPVQTLPEVTSDPQARENDFFVAYDHPTHGHLEIVANPIKLSGTPAKVRMPAPEFNQHTEEILLEHGYTWEDILRLKDQGVIA